LQTILQRISAGDQTAVAACLDEYGGLVWRLAMRYLNSRTEAEDATQEIFVSLWSSAHRFDPAKGSEPAFVATVAHRRLIDMKRSAWVRRSVSIEKTPEPSGNTPTQLEAGSWGSEADTASKAFGKLPPDERDALWLAIRGGLTHSQIAAATDLPIGTVKSRLRRGVQRLRDMAAAGAGHHGIGEGGA
jgi:RNA polymerase sigma-70 factor (ECF subfamily)